MPGRFSWRMKRFSIFMEPEQEAMSKAKFHECTNCGEMLRPQPGNHRYDESGLSNVVLQRVGIADCPKCGNSDVIIPHVIKIHQAIAAALANSPARLAGDQLRFLRKHLEVGVGRRSDWAGE